MSDFTARITEILLAHNARVESHPISGYAPMVGCRCQPRTLINDFPMTQTEHRAHVAALIAEAAEQHYRRRIETVEQLLAIPPTTIIKTEGGSIACRFHDGIHGVVFGDDRPFKWSCLEGELPAVVLWSPGAGE